MPLSHILVVYLISTLIVFLPSFGLAKMFQKAGVASWKAYIPFYNTWIMQELAQRPRHWVFWQFIPVVGWFISPGIFIEFVKLFGRFTLGEHILAALFAPFYFPYLGYSQKIHYIGPEAARRYKKPGWREWIDAAIFAIVAATLIRTFIFEAYTIPSGSMERTLLINDFLFVSKFSYGPRIPNTPLSIPFVHNYIPGTHRKSYSELIELPYIRWFASPVKAGDVVVFNFPAGDTVINLDDYQSAVPYYQVIRDLGRGNEQVGRGLVLDNPDQYPLAIHPPDKTDNYIKRCIAVAGDTVKIVNGNVLVNSKNSPYPPQSQTDYKVYTKTELNLDLLEENYGVNPSQVQSVDPNSYRMYLTPENAQKLRTNPDVINIAQVIADSITTYDYSFPLYVQQNKWTMDNYGPIWIPRKGATLPLNPGNYSIYERVIRVYEHNDFYTQNGKYYLNGKEVNSYTFKMDYYWMMGDNRHLSQDSRYWGFVPEDRVVGKAWLIWFSWENGPRWNRLFRTVK
jgi:signal peptidase I